MVHRCTRCVYCCCVVQPSWRLVQQHASRSLVSATCWFGMFVLLFVTIRWVHTWCIHSKLSTIMYHHNRLVARCAWRWVQSSRATGATAWYTCCPHTQSSQRHKEGSAGGAAGALPSSLATASVVVVVAGSVYSSSGEGGGGCRTFCSGSGTHDSSHSGVKEKTSSTTTAASAPASARRTAPTAIVCKCCWCCIVLW